MDIPDFPNFYNLEGVVTDVNGLEVTVEVPSGLEPWLYPLYIESGQYTTDFMGGVIVEFRLNGANPEKINLNSEFIDFGVIAKWRSDAGRIYDVSSFVRRYGNVITDKFGIYPIQYVLEFGEHSSVIDREIIVQEPDWIKNSNTPKPYLDKVIFEQFIDRLYDVFYELNWKIDHSRFGFDTTRKQVPQWTSDFNVTDLENFFDAVDAVDLEDNKLLFTKHDFNNLDTITLDAQGNTLPTGLAEQGYIVFSVTRNSITLTTDGINPVDITALGSGEIKIVKTNAEVSLTGWVYELAFPDNDIIEEPGTPRLQWDAQKSYIIGDLVSFGGSYYYSQTNRNQGYTPTAGTDSDPWKLSSWIPLYESQRIGRLEDDISIALAKSIGIPSWMYTGLLNSLADKRTITEIFKLIIELRGTQDGFLSFLKIVQEGFTGTYELQKPDYAEWNVKAIYFPGTQVTYGSQLWECLVFNQATIPSTSNPYWKLAQFDISSDDLFIARTHPEEVRFIFPGYYTTVNLTATTLNAKNTRSL